MPFDRHFPPEAEAALLTACAGTPIALRLTADLDAGQRFAPVYIALTGETVLVIPCGQPLMRWPIAGLSAARTDELFGSGRLVLTSAEGERTICHFSRDLVPEFAACARAITDLIKGRAVRLPELDGSPYCPRCQAPLPERGTNCPRCVPRGEIFLRILGLMRPYRGQLALLMAATLFSVAVQMLPPLAYKQITDRVIGHGHLPELPWWVGMIFASFLAAGLCRLLSQNLAIAISGRVVTELQSRLHDHLSRLRVSYHGKRTAGELVGRVMNDTNELQAFLTNGLPYLLGNTLLMVAIAGVLISLNPLLALVAFLPIPLLLLGSAWFWKRLIPLFHQRDSRRGQLFSLLGESLRGIKVVKALNQEGRRAGEFARANQQALASQIMTERTNFTFFEVVSLIMQFGTVGVWYLGARGVVGSHGSHPSLGDLMAFAGYLAMFYGPLQWFAAVLNWMTGAFAGAERIFQVLDQQPEPYSDSSDAVPALASAGANAEAGRSAGAGAGVPGVAPRIAGTVEFRHVSFGYERGKDVLKDVSLRVEAGEMLGLVGRSGAGKSTIIGLLCRFHEPDHGGILVDGRPLSQWPLEGYRRQIGIVMQDPFLFHGTILENIRYGCPYATAAEVVEAAKAASCHDFILQKEDGYDTMVGDGGIELSGGERQRLSIARAILGDPRILILDEATSAVDSETEKAIQESIARLVRGRTTIAIAHRLATLRNADRLAVIDDGCVVELGTHEQLLAKPDGHFATMVRLQGEINKLRSEQVLEIT